MDTNLHLASLQDMDLILPLVRAYHEFEQLKSTEAGRKSAVQTLLLNPDIGGLWLIYYGDELAGYVVLCRGFSIEFNGFDAFIDEFFIGVDFRRMGIATKVLELLKGEALKLKVNVLHLEVARDNNMAQKL